VAEGVQVNEKLFMLAVFVAVWLAMSLTTKPLLDELRKGKTGEGISCRSALVARAATECSFGADQ